MMKQVKLHLLGILAIAVPAVAQAMPTSEFVSRWRAAAQNPNRLSAETFANQSEVKALTDELGKAFASYKAVLMKARAEHKQPPSCPPTDGNFQINEIVSAAAALPQEWQSREFSDSLQEIMAHRFPCHSVTTP